MSTFETTTQTGPGSEAWEAFWTLADADRVYASDGYSPVAVAAGVAALRQALGQESYATDYFTT